jgi:hypothetical protein
VLDVPLNTAYSRLRRAKITLLARLRELAPDRVDLDRVVGHPLAGEPGVVDVNEVRNDARHDVIKDVRHDVRNDVMKDAKNERDACADKDRASAPVELR